MEFLVVVSEDDKAGMGIMRNLIEFKKQIKKNKIESEFSRVDFAVVKGSILETKNLDLNVIKKYDFIFFASKHQSEKKTKTLCVHASGNWRENEAGGEFGKICPSSALIFKKTFQKMKEIYDKYPLENYEISMEATHHGPLIEKPCLFIEIGSTEEEWKNPKACFIVSKTIKETIEEFRPNPYNEVAVAIGGSHYCPKFNQLQLNSNYAISHIIPKYKLPLKIEMIEEAISKTSEEVDLILVEFDGLGNSEVKKQVMEILDKQYLKVIKI